MGEEEAGVSRHLSSSPRAEQQCPWGCALAPEQTGREPARLYGHRKGTVLSGDGPDHGARSQGLEGLAALGNRQAEGGEAETRSAQR